MACHGHPAARRRRRRPDDRVGNSAAVAPRCSRRRPVVEPMLVEGEAGTVQLEPAAGRPAVEPTHGPVRDAHQGSPHAHDDRPDVRGHGPPRGRLLPRPVELKGPPAAREAAGPRAARWTGATRKVVPRARLPRRDGGVHGSPGSSSRRLLRYGSSGGGSVSRPSRWRRRSRRGRRGGSSDADQAQRQTQEAPQAPPQRSTTHGAGGVDG